LDNGYEELDITSRHVLAVGELPQIHKDPFDRLLLAQARVEGISLLTSDERLSPIRCQFSPLNLPAFQFNTLLEIGNGDYREAGPRWGKLRIAGGATAAQFGP
jgi:hypothetical protein